MNHLDDFQINAYLDGTLDAEPRRAVETHLLACEECHRQAEALRHVFELLTALPDEPLENDLSAGVLAQLPQKPLRVSSPRLAPLLALQGLAAVVLSLAALALAWPKLAPALENARQWAALLVTGWQWPSVNWQAGLQPLQEALAAAGAQTTDLLQLPIAAWALILACALAAWLLGNRLVFRETGSHSMTSKRRLL